MDLVPFLRLRVDQRSFSIAGMDYVVHESGERKTVALPILAKLLIHCYYT